MVRTAIRLYRLCDLEEVGLEAAAHVGGEVRAAAARSAGDEWLLYEQDDPSESADTRCAEARLASRLTDVECGREERYLEDERYRSSRSAPDR